MTEKNRAFPWVIEKRVLPQHTDHAGVMWHGAYISFLEEARVDALAQVGLKYSDMSSLGFEMPVVSIKLNYLNPLRHGERFVLESWLLPSKGIRFSWQSNFLRDDKTLIAKANIDLVLVNHNGEKFQILRHFPDQISKAILSLQNGPGTK